MKKFLSKIFVVLLLIAVFVPANFTFAQNVPLNGAGLGVTPVTDTSNLNNTLAAYNTCITSGAKNCNQLYPEQSTPVISGCSPLSVSVCVGDALGGLSIVVLQIMSLLLGLAGLTLNWVINITVVNMSTYVSGMTGINIAWKVIRDLMNIAFIFLLVYESIKLIIGQSSRDNVKRFITGIVIASLLINFSLFFTKLLIDASNIVTIGFYNSILGTSAATTAQTTSATTANGTQQTVPVIDPNAYGLSNAFQRALGLQGLFSGTNIANLNSSVSGGDNYALLVVGLMGSILFLITAFVFSTIAVLFITRFVILIVLLMLSPIAYMGLAFTVLPSIEKYSKQWWDSLMGQLLFAPIYMLMTWVIITLMNSPGFINTNPTQWAALVLNAAGTTGSNLPAPGSLGLLFNFALIIGLAIASLVIAKSFATQGATQIKDLAGKGTAFAGGAIFGTASSVSRNTIGRAGNAIANNEDLKIAASKGGVTGFLAKQALVTGDAAAKSTFDVRSTENFKSLAKATSTDFGKGADAKKVSFQKDLEAIGKREGDFAKTLKVNLTDEDKDRIKRNSTLVARAEGVTSEKEINKRVTKAITDAENKRINDYAKTFSDETNMGKAWRYTVNIFKVGVGGTIGNTVGGVTGAIAGGAGGFRVRTKADQKAIAKEIKKASGKSKVEQLANLTKEIANEDADDNAGAAAPAGGAAGGTAGGTPGATPGGGTP